MVWVISAELKDEYKIFVEFNDGINGIIDFKEKLSNDPRQIIKDLLDLNKFRTVKADMDTLCWDNGVDFAPEYLYERIMEGIKKVA
jgi:hypothetical protein